MATAIVTIPLLIILIILGVCFGSIKHFLGLKKNKGILPVILIVGWILIFACVHTHYSTSPGDAEAYNSDFLFPFITFMTVSAVYWLIAFVIWGISGTASGFTQSCLKNENNNCTEEADKPLQDLITKLNNRN